MTKLTPSFWGAATEKPLPAATIWSRARHAALMAPSTDRPRPTGCGQSQIHQQRRLTKKAGIKMAFFSPATEKKQGPKSSSVRTSIRCAICALSDLPFLRLSVIPKKVKIEVNSWMDSLPSRGRTTWVGQGFGWGWTGTWFTKPWLARSRSNTWDMADGFVICLTLTSLLSCCDC